MKLFETLIICAFALSLCESQLVKHVIQETDKTIKGISRVVTDRLFGGINFGISAQASVSSQGDGSGEREPPRRQGLFGLPSLLHQHHHQESFHNHNQFQGGGDYGNYQGGRNPQHNYQQSQENNFNGFQSGGNYGNNHGGRQPQDNYQNSQENNQHGHRGGGNYGHHHGGSNPQHNYQNSQENNQHGHQGEENYGHHHGGSNPQHNYHNSQGNNQNGYQGAGNYGNNQGGQKPQHSQGNHETQAGESVKGEEENNGQQPPVMQVSHPPTEAPKDVDKEKKPTFVALPPDSYTYGTDGIKVMEPTASGGDSDDDFAIDIRNSFDKEIKQ